MSLRTAGHFVASFFSSLQTLKWFFSFTNINQPWNGTFQLFLFPFSLSFFLFSFFFLFFLFFFLFSSLFSFFFLFLSFFSYFSYFSFLFFFLISLISLISFFFFSVFHFPFPFFHFQTFFLFPLFFPFPIFFSFLFCSFLPWFSFKLLDFIQIFCNTKVCLKLSQL